MRTEKTVENLKRVAADLQEIVAVLNAVADEMIAAERPTISIHSKTQIERHLPMLLQWVYKIEADAKVHLRPSSNQTPLGSDASTNGKEKTVDRIKPKRSKSGQT